MYVASPRNSSPSMPESHSRFASMCFASPRIVCVTSSTSPVRSTASTTCSASSIE